MIDSRQLETHTATFVGHNLFPFVTVPNVCFFLGGGSVGFRLWESSRERGYNDDNLRCTLFLSGRSFKLSRKASEHDGGLFALHQNRGYEQFVISQKPLYKLRI